VCLYVCVRVCVLEVGGACVRVSAFLVCVFIVAV